MHRVVPALLAAATLLLPLCARASEPYPGALQGDLELDAAPGCDLCHREAKEPVGPADTLFAKSATLRGLAGEGDVESLASALTKMGEDGVDSDGDGAQDLDELSWGGDPNEADVPEGTLREPVRYGCAWHGAPASGAVSGIALAALAALAMRQRAREKRRRA